MSLDLDSLRDATSRHGWIARITVAEAAGSAPREAGASMLVWKDGQSGTIGGGKLEFDATAAARTALETGTPSLRRIPLGPALGQCCGGAVTLLTEIFDRDSLPALAPEATSFARPLPGTAPGRPLAVDRLLGQFRNGSAAPRLTLLDGWIVEPLRQPDHLLWVHGAGHVGRAIVGILAPLTDWQISWIDTHESRFPDPLPEGVTRIVAADPARVVAYAPPEAHHLVLTYSHALDLALCHALLARGFASAGLIGSATKWSRFRKRLRQLGHSDASIARIACPIGDPGLGKAPQAIAIGVTGLLLRSATARGETAMDRPA